jgi:hypothetical protein
MSSELSEMIAMAKPTVSTTIPIVLNVVALLSKTLILFISGSDRATFLVALIVLISP